MTPMLGGMADLLCGAWCLALLALRAEAEDLIAISTLQDSSSAEVKL
jgi:hypothetical protein